MTLTSALPAQAATDVLGRRMPEDLGDGSSADQSGSFPELLGQLAAHPEERALAQPAVSGKTGVQDPSRSPLPWKFRIADVLALTGGVEVLAADAAGDLQAGTTTLETVANAEDLWANVPDVAQELLAGERGGEPDDTEDGQRWHCSPISSWQSVPQRPVDLAGLFRVMEIAALAENGAGAGAAPSDAQVWSDRKTAALVSRLSLQPQWHRRQEAPIRCWRPRLVTDRCSTCHPWRSATQRRLAKRWIRRLCPLPPRRPRSRCCALKRICRPWRMPRRSCRLPSASRRS